MAAKSRKWLYLNWLLDLIFPKLCTNCGKEGHYFCDINYKSEPSVEYFKPKRGWYLDGILSGADYNTDFIAQAIQTMKYHRIPEIAKDLGNWLNQRLGGRIAPTAILIPVPLHPARATQRGFNQALLVAQSFGRWPVVEALRRRVNTIPQVELSRSKRRTNVAQVFAPTPAIAQVVDEVVVLIDDVITTGSTLNSAAKVLKKHGARKVFGLVVARD